METRSGTIDTIDYVTGIGNYSHDVHYNVYKQVKRPCFMIVRMLKQLFGERSCFLELGC